jgi:ankyrin repeat protein
MAAATGSAGLAKLLLEAGANKGLATATMLTPLAIAEKAGNTELVKLFQGNGPSYC